MEWYEGGITDAISTARDDDRLITVYVYGEYRTNVSLEVPYILEQSSPS